MEPIIQSAFAQSAFAGIIAALAVTTILGVARYAQQWWDKRQEVRYLRALLTSGMERVMAQKTRTTRVWRHG